MWINQFDLFYFIHILSIFVDKSLKPKLWIKFLHGITNQTCLQSFVLWLERQMNYFKCLVIQFYCRLIIDTQFKTHMSSLIQRLNKLW